VKWLRIGGVVALVCALVLVERLTGLSDQLSREALRGHVAAAGPWGIPLFLAVFCVALFLHIPATGILFVGVGVALYGPVAGAALAFAGAALAVMFSFVIVRGVGGKPFAEVKNKYARRILARLESHPIWTVIVMRLIFFVGAPVNYALALSSIRTRDYVLGSLLGMVAPTVVLALGFDVLIAAF
jgi:uncharacterized membrane protein YdjX (TVP38/TMEM64 family)